MRILFIGIVLLIGCEALNQRFGLKDDNIVEETLEEEIKRKTGIDMDLTPSTPET